MKNKKNKNLVKFIVCAVLVVILVALASTTLILAFNQKDFNVNVKSPNEIRIYSPESGSFYEHSYRNTDEEYQNISSLLKNSYKFSLLSLVMSGNANKETFIENRNSQSNVMTNVIKQNPNYFYVEFQYEGEKTLMIGDKPYHRDDNDDIVTYRRLLFEIKDTVGFAEITVYVENFNKYSSSDTISSSYQIISYANHATIYSYVDSLLNK